MRLPALCFKFYNIILRLREVTMFTFRKILYCHSEKNLLLELETLLKILENAVLYQYMPQ